MAMSNVTKGLVAAVAAGVVIGGVYYLMSGGTEPEIPSCPACSAKVNSLNVQLTGDFGTVLPAWVRTEMSFTPTQKKPAKLPVTSEHYNQSVGRTPFVPVTEAKMHFFYKVGNTEVEGSKTLNFAIQ
jgi:hypothetical protein